MGSRQQEQDYEERKDNSPCGIALGANNSASVESVFHGASRKDAKGAKCKASRHLTADSRRLAQTKKQQDAEKQPFLFVGR